MVQKAFMGGVMGAKDMMRKPQAAQNGGGKPPEKDDKKSEATEAIKDAIKGGTKK